MASGASEVSICNLALSHLGEASITALSDNTKPARECNRLYAITRDMELRSHNWNFAMKRTMLASDPTDPSWGYDKRYTLPVDLMRVVEVDFDEDWRVEAGELADEGARFLLTNLSGPIYIRYVARVTDPSVFDTLFINALAARLAVDLAVPLTQNSTIRQGAERTHLRATQQAKAFDAIESSPRKFPEPLWLSRRN